MQPKSGPLGAVLARPNDDPIKIVAVALTLCLVCSIVVSATAVGLRPLQEKNRAQALQREIIEVAGLYRPGVEIDDAFGRIETRLVDLDSGRLVDTDPHGYSYRAAAGDPSLSMPLGSKDPARIHRRPSLMPVYLVRDEAGALQRVILPVYGAGLWSTLHGLLALAPDTRTVRALTFYEQAETAGLGSGVAEARWLDKWQGKQVLDDAGNPVVKVVKGSVVPDAHGASHQVDGLSGATLTGDGVTRLMQFWLGERGFGPFLQRVRRGEV